MSHSVADEQQHAYQPPQSLVSRFDAAVGRWLKRVTFDLYQPYEAQNGNRERGQMLARQPRSSGRVPVSADTNLVPIIESLNQQTIAQLYELGHIEHVAVATSERMSNIYTHTAIRTLNDLDMVNKLKKVAPTLTKEQEKRLAQLEEHYLNQMGANAQLAYRSLLAQTIMQRRGESSQVRRQTYFNRATGS